MLVYCYFSVHVSCCRDYNRVFADLWSQTLIKCCCNSVSSMAPDLAVIGKKTITSLVRRHQLRNKLNKTNMQYVFRLQGLIFYDLVFVRCTYMYINVLLLLISACLNLQSLMIYWNMIFDVERMAQKYRNTVHKCVTPHCCM